MKASNIHIDDLKKRLPESYEPNWELLENADNEESFSEAAFYLLQECGSVCAVIASLQTSETLTRNQAIINGLAVRLSKLTKVIIRDLSNRSTFQQLSFSRQIFETSGTLIYLLQDDGSGSRYDEYILYTLVEEKKIFESVRRNIDKREGEVWNIENRIKNSITQTAKSAGITDISEIPGRNSIGFPKVEERLKLLGALLGTDPHVIYVPYRSGSSEIHGTWSDLYRNHLTEIADGEFVPQTADPPVRPQIATTVTNVLVSVFGSYLDVLGVKEVSNLLKPKLYQLITTNDNLENLHEQFLARTQTE